MLSEDYLAVIAYVRQYKEELPLMVGMKQRLKHGDDLADDQVAIVLDIVKEETDYA